MDKKLTTINLSIICPTLNEAGNLPLLIADLNLWPDDIELNIVDGGSKDLTVFISNLSGANLLTTAEPNRGKQLSHGANSAKGEWLLFLHADCRLHKNWSKAIMQIINQSQNKQYGWFFDFRLKKTNIFFTILQLAVYIRSYIFQRPYGDQGLLISKQLYNEIGGYNDLYIMEDLDFVIRLGQKTKLKRIGIPLFTDHRKWQHTNILNQALKNASFKARWQKGEDTKLLASEYYK
ncbi:TIGR04283 family arsenosugar biosynthesis glycosyltransferase [Prochlorococcus sp. MIT 1223]|uniref:TIGR04283 family arsenosugar biosynthesis glycosyltransferase n=1 Tax=Prochlorococcus sp. MIT 1223 TaxID=3096217 RepID=UPI002A7623A8|nr:TIGR04283 family arsenosugar biosynthesis glycosyltransferase [Prochlorococcus sp. MIT 1223]